MDKKSDEADKVIDEAGGDKSEGDDIESARESSIGPIVLVLAIL